MNKHDVRIRLSYCNADKKYYWGFLIRVGHTLMRSLLLFLYSYASLSLFFYLDRNTTPNTLGENIWIDWKQSIRLLLSPLYWKVSVFTFAIRCHSPVSTIQFKFISTFSRYPESWIYPNHSEYKIFQGDGFSSGLDRLTFKY